MRLTLKSKCMNAVACSVPMEFTPTWKIREWTMRRRPMAERTFAQCVWHLCCFGVLEKSGRGSFVEYRFNRNFRMPAFLLLAMAASAQPIMPSSVPMETNDGPVTITVGWRPAPVRQTLLFTNWPQTNFCASSVSTTATFTTFHPVEIAVVHVGSNWVWSLPTFISWPKPVTNVFVLSATVTNWKQSWTNAAPWPVVYFRPGYSNNVARTFYSTRPTGAWFAYTNFPPVINSNRNIRLSFEKKEI